MVTASNGRTGRKIALSGAFSSGKTTLFGVLSNRFPELTPYPEIASATKAIWPELDWRRDDVRGYLRWAQILSERTQEAAGGVGLFDGSFVDAVAHERIFGTRLTALSPDVEPRPYDLTLLCDPADVPLEINGIRETDEALRRDIQALLVEEAARRSARVVLLKGPLDVRIATAAAEVQAILEALRR